MHRAVSLQILLLLLCGGHVHSEDECIKASVATCDACIKSGPGCVWCQDLNFTKRGELEAVRCDTLSEILKRGCPRSKIVNPPNDQRKIRDKPLSEGKQGNSPVQIQPQEIYLELRPGKPHTFEFKFKRAEGYPVDLYYLMDLSYSMNDDLKNVKNLGIELLKNLKKITGSARIGFGSFVDKTLLPFTDTNEEKLQKPCPREETQCEPAFGYKHVLSLTDDGESFRKMVSLQRISGNLDTPEGSLDAIMQAVTCVDEIGWGNSTRLLVLATDAGFHMAGDGKLAGILEPNQEYCQLDKKNMYIKSNLWDYPSVGQIARKLEEKNIQPIFAVTEKVADVYRELSQLIPKSEVGVLSNDSSNVVKLIVDAYNKLSSNIIVTHDNLPNDITVTYTDCEGKKEHSDKGTCNNVNIGKEVTFSVTVKALTCTDEKTFNIGPLGFNEKLTVRVKTRCECECDNERNTQHEHCNKQGSVVCGTCRCNPGYLGQRCECSLGKKDEAALKAQCRKDNGTECEGRGDCECGVCKCHLTEAGNSYYGPHCECDDEHCEKYQNKLCGGNGDCKCGECKCKDGFEGTACQCKKSNDGCLTRSGSECHGRGKCMCNQCSCERGYKGPKCETCHTCSVPCQKSGSCIECLGFGSGPFQKNCTESCSHLKAETEEKLLKSDCRVKDHEGCWMSFTMTEQDGFDKYNVKILKTRECPEGPNVGAIVGGSLAGVALIGLLILLLIKGLIYVKDLKEWKRFEKEQQRRKWADGENPLFQKATTTVANPTFTGDS
ncbi:integrin beta-2 [Colossoma macropomum]|uniref:integrin beta-2 n=1 Tax=Colossoma macropomum TaxID=42526 RepID=UPI001864AFD8|nr:integrin beta-2 [Colossoma macropomum]XP_036425201.1 integrin beta-2 [Colossoma macropomum]XP_036425210.1 integrin beta-2 [Colossoma macropomum]XP_036425218.1 integrin beta-2 [Colossoma macropomum]XP_036425227.1 integrin beta-2 [Colossoma macropomum]XP_036425235.1 integrin beta-2 [Colossoma macropomum]XP_036425245.1 integrin beta-2 [Colossoma macropomum]